VTIFVTVWGSIVQYVDGLMEYGKVTLTLRVAIAVRQAVI